MRDVTLLRREAMRSYEIGRIRFAARVAVIVVPLTLVSAWETGAPLESGLAGVSLLAATMVMRWWHRRGADAASAGLRTGAVPALAALALCRFAPTCPPQVALGLCVGAGLVSGALVGRAALQHSRTPWQRWAAVALVAALTATLGCVGLGLGTVGGAITAIAIGTAAATALSRA